MRAELASIADKQMRSVLGEGGPTPVYEGGRATGSVALDKVNNAIDNYKAAVACFVRVLPSLSDQKSVELVRSEIRRLLARLGELQDILRRVKNDDDITEEEKDFKIEEERTTNSLLHDLKFSVGDDVVVDNVKSGKISSVDLEKGTYGVTYNDDSIELNIPEPRIQLKPLVISHKSDLKFADVNEAERYELWSEIVESEKIYRDSLKNLLELYLTPMDSPMQWIGEKIRNDTKFSKKTLTESEKNTIFGNSEDIYGTADMVYNSLEKRFMEWKLDQKLAEVFLEFGSLYDQYPIYAETFNDALQLIQKIRQERSSFEAIEMRAKQFGAAPLETLLRLPMERPSEMKRLLSLLSKRTKETHPDFQYIREAFVLFGKIEEQLQYALHRVELEAKVKEVEKLFEPQISLAKKGRRILKSSLSLKRIEGPNAVARLVWVFNDLVLVGRKSEWNEWGFKNVGYRYVDIMQGISKARGALEYGPFAFEISNETQTWIFVTNSEEEKREWLLALKGFIPVKKSRRKSTLTVQADVSDRRSSTAVSPPPPPPPLLPFVKNSSSTQLGQETLKVMMKLKENQHQSGALPSSSLPLPPRNQPVWRRARAKYTFKGEQLTDLPFKKGEVLEVLIDTPNFVPNSWITARRLTDTESGQVPANYLEFL